MLSSFQSFPPSWVRGPRVGGVIPHVVRFSHSVPVRRCVSGGPRARLALNLFPLLRRALGNANGLLGLDYKAPVPLGALWRRPFTTSIRVLYALGMATPYARLLVLSAFRHAYDSSAPRQQGWTRCIRLR